MTRSDDVGKLPVPYFGYRNLLVRTSSHEMLCVQPLQTKCNSPGTIAELSVSFPHRKLLLVMRVVSHDIRCSTSQPKELAAQHGAKQNQPVVSRLKAVSSSEVFVDLPAPSSLTVCEVESIVIASLELVAAHRRHTSGTGCDQE